MNYIFAIKEERTTTKAICRWKNILKTQINTVQQDAAI
jgi:hypothetical protein